MTASFPPGPPPAPPPSAVAEAELDAAALATLRSLDPSGAARLIERVVGAFETSTARLLPQLRAARDGKDAESVKQVAHTLRSSSASLGAVKLSRLCAEIETMIREGQPYAALDSRVALLDAEIQAALAALRKLLRGGS